VTQIFTNMHEAMTAQLVCKDQPVIAAVEQTAEERTPPRFELYLVQDPGQGDAE
jgi:hypothetical protein